MISGDLTVGFLFGANLFLSLLATTLLFTSSRNSFWIGSYDFSKVGLRRNLGSSVLAATRVYELFLPSTILSTILQGNRLFCCNAYCSPRMACALRAVGLLGCVLFVTLYPVDYLQNPVDCLMFLPKADSSKSSQQSTGFILQPAVAAIWNNPDDFRQSSRLGTTSSRLLRLLSWFSTFFHCCSTFACFCMIFTIPTKSTQKLKTKWKHIISYKIIN